MKYSSRTFVSGLLVLLLLCPLVTSAQWKKKPPSEWSKSDVEKVLNESPWGITQTFTNNAAMFREFPNQQPNTAVNTVSVPNATHIDFRVRFLSAKPIRLAVKRMMELAQKDKMSPELASSLETFVSGEFLEYIVVTVMVESKQQGVNFSEAIGLLQTNNTVKLKNTTFLELKNGKRVFLEEYQTPRSDGLGARFIFPRMVEGKPFIMPDSQEVRFVSELSGSYVLNRRFKVKDMMYEGNLEF